MNVGQKIISGLNQVYEKLVDLKQTANAELAKTREKHITREKVASSNEKKIDKAMQAPRSSIEDVAKRMSRALERAMDNLRAFRDTIITPSPMAMKNEVIWVKAEKPASSPASTETLKDKPAHSSNTPQVATEKVAIPKRESIFTNMPAVQSKMKEIAKEAPLTAESKTYCKTAVWDLQKMLKAGMTHEEKEGVKDIATKLVSISGKNEHFHIPAQIRGMSDMTVVDSSFKAIRESKIIQQPMQKYPEPESLEERFAIEAHSEPDYDGKIYRTPGAIIDKLGKLEQKESLDENSAGFCNIVAQIYLDRVISSSPVLVAKENEGGELYKHESPLTNEEKAEIKAIAQKMELLKDRLEEEGSMAPEWMDRANKLASEL